MRTLELFKPVCAAGTVKYARILRGLEVYIDVYVQLPTVNHSGVYSDSHMCRNEYYLRYKNLTSDLSTYTSFNNDTWFFKAVRENGVQLDLFLQIDDNKLYLCAESTAAAVIVVRSLTPDDAIPMESLYSEPYDTIRVTLNTNNYQGLLPTRE